MYVQSINQCGDAQVSKDGDDDPLSALTAATGSSEAEPSVGGSAAGSGNGGGGRQSRGHSRGGGSGGGGGTGGAWRRYYEGLELIEEIRRDLTRLYPRWVTVLALLDLMPAYLSYTPLPHNLDDPNTKRSGVREEHFVRPRTQEALLAVLFVWATQHKDTAYRQVGV